MSRTTATDRAEQAGNAIGQDCLNAIQTAKTQGARIAALQATVLDLQRATNFIATCACPKSGTGYFHAKPHAGIGQARRGASWGCDTVIPGASNTTKHAGSLSDNEVFSRPEFAKAVIPALHGFGRDGANRKAARSTCFELLTSRPPVARSKAASGFQSRHGAETMTTVNTITTPKAAHLGNTPAMFTTPIARQQAIENALSMALYHVRHGDTAQGLRAATVKAIRAASMLKQACAESASGSAA